MGKQKPDPKEIAIPLSMLNLLTLMHHDGFHRHSWILLEDNSSFMISVVRLGQLFDLFTKLQNSFENLLPDRVHIEILAVRKESYILTIN